VLQRRFQVLDSRRRRKYHYLNASLTLAIAVLDLDPIRLRAAAVGALVALGDHALKAELAGLAEKVRADLARPKTADKDALRPARQLTIEIVLAQRQLAQIFAVQRAAAAPRRRSRD
jgi:hypothetical protein